ncbi:MAG: hypothetical protein WB612_01075 [Nitrososphaeraceae archaeon]
MNSNTRNLIATIVGVILIAGVLTIPLTFDHQSADARKAKVKSVKNTIKNKIQAITRAAAGGASGIGCVSAVGVAHCDGGAGAAGGAGGSNFGLSGSVSGGDACQQVVSGAQACSTGTGGSANGGLSGPGGVGGIGIGGTGGKAGDASCGLGG